MKPSTFRNVWLVLAFAAALLAGARGADPDDPDGLRAWERHRIEARVPAVLFPQARFVRLYRCDCYIVAKEMLKTGGGWDESVPITPDEIASLRRSVFYAPERHVFSLCIYPRNYAFLFFDARRKLVGLVAVDDKYDDETDISPMNPPNAELVDVMIDQPAIERIILAHRAELTYRGC